MSNIKSMTAYAKSEFENDDFKLTVEIRSVNHRFLDINFKIPQVHWSLENNFRKIISEFVSRGHLDVIIQREEKNLNKEPSLTLNKALFESYLAVYEETLENYLSTSISKENVIDILGKKDVITSSSALLFENEENEIINLLKNTLEKLCIMKEKEGDALGNDIESRFKKLKLIKDEILKLENNKKDTNAYFNNLKEKILNVTKDLNISLNEDRIITEVSLIVDRLDITEELVRLESHFNQKDEIMKEYPLGRKLEFLLQEISREFNTIASKISDAVVQSNVVEAKAELEKIREQIQNIE